MDSWEISNSSKFCSSKGRVIFPDSSRFDQNDGFITEGVITRKDSKSDDGEETLGAIIGVVVFTLVVIIAAVVVVNIIKRRKNKLQEESLEEVNMRYDVEDAEEKINMIRPTSFLK